MSDVEKNTRYITVVALNISAQNEEREASQCIPDDYKRSLGGKPIVNRVF